jgi:hypothetical protein
MDIKQFRENDWIITNPERAAVLKLSGKRTGYQG